MIQSFAERFCFDESKIHIVKTLSDYLTFISEVADNSEDIGLENYVSRGQKDCSFALLPSIMRITKKKISSKEMFFKDKFKLKVSYYDQGIVKRNDDIVARNDKYILTYGQHFGLPTRYLDFTESHLLSLLFALEDYEYERPAVVYLTNAKQYNEKTTNQSYKFIDSSSANNDESYFIKVQDTNDRVHFQNGCFLRCSDTFIHEMDDEDYKSIFENSEVALIEKNYKKNILMELFNMGITFESIYPDIDNVVKNIKFKESGYK